VKIFIKFNIKCPSEKLPAISHPPHDLWFPRIQFHFYQQIDEIWRKNGCLWLFRRLSCPNGRFLWRFFDCFILNNFQELF
jgi:hypothetical protein